jgi:hypothetical protein
MNQEINLIRARLRTPRAAAFAGIVFSVLLIIILVLLRLNIPAYHYVDILYTLKEAQVLTMVV